jgi:uncharacterized membrane protein AbrB (regulator of aidB expression)
MDAVSTKAPKDLACCGGGVLAGYLIFALLNFWLYGEFWGAGLAFLLHAPVFIVYIAILLFLRRRWPHIISRAALVVCGVAVGLFPVLGWFPVYYFRWDIAAIILGIQIGSVAFLGFVTYFTMRLSKRLRET